MPGLAIEIPKRRHRSGGRGAKVDGATGWCKVGRTSDERGGQGDNMAEQTPCSRCRHANPQENRFCGWCGASLGAGSDLVARQGNNPTVMGHALPVKPGPVGKALAVGLGTLAVRAGISWLRYRTTGEKQSSALSARESDTAVSERHLGQRLEEVLIQELEGEHPGRFLAWRTVRSIVITGPTDRRARKSAPFPPPEATKTCSLATRLANLIPWSVKATLKLL
jgi:hypothetical protein